MKIISYFGNLYLNHFKRDCKEIKKHGFDTILFCVTETDIKWNSDNIKAMREYAEMQNLKTLAGPWGLGSVFGGEAVSTVNYQRDGLDNVSSLFDIWLSCVREIGFETVFLDEPHAGNETLKFVNNIYNKHNRTIDFYICLCDDTFNKFTDDDIINLPFKSVGLSAYFWTKDHRKIQERTVVWIERLIKLRPGDHHVWIQGFDLPKGSEFIPFMVYNIASQLGVSDFGFWAYKSAEATSAKRAGNYKRVWKQIYLTFGKNTEQLLR